MSSEIEETRFNLIHEHERTRESVTTIIITNNICRRKYGVSRHTTSGRKGTLYSVSMDKERSHRPHTIRNEKVTPELEQKTIIFLPLLGLYLDSSFGTARIKFRLQEARGSSVAAAAAAGQCTRY